MQEEAGEVKGIKLVGNGAGLWCLKEARAERESSKNC